MSLNTVGGQGLTFASGVVTQLQPPGSTRIIGNAQSYFVASPYQAYTGMWGVFVTLDSGLISSSDMLIYTATFPANTTINWSVVPDSRWGGVSGYLTVSYGNYDGSAGVITPKQAKNIVTLQPNVNWTFPSGNASGLLCECWLTTTSHASGSLTDQVFEIGFLPRCSTASQTFAAGLTAVGTGSFTDINGVVWNVGNAGGTPPYIVATRPSYVDFVGALDFKSYFTFLTTSGVITGNEYFNGLAFGVEPYTGTGSLTINSFTTTYN